METGLKLQKLLAKKKLRGEHYWQEAFKPYVGFKNLCGGEFPDGALVFAHKLAEHLYVQVDEEGNLTQLFKGIIGHCKNSKAVEKADQSGQQ